MIMIIIYQICFVSKNLILACVQAWYELTYLLIFFREEISKHAHFNADLRILLSK